MKATIHYKVLFTTQGSSIGQRSVVWPRSFCRLSPSELILTFYYSNTSIFTIYALRMQHCTIYAIKVRQHRSMGGGGFSFIAQ